MSLLAEIQKAARAHPNDDPLRLARRLLAQLGRPTLLQLIAEEIKHQQRESKRTGPETRAFAEWFAHRDSAATKTAFGVRAALSPVFADTFSLGGGESVTWGRASIEQHERRIVMLEKIRAGIADTIARHREAIRILRETGAACLEEVTERAA